MINMQNQGLHISMFIFFLMLQFTRSNHISRKLFFIIALGSIIVGNDLQAGDPI